ncbi:MAG: hypothetical protein HFH09_01885 [Bacilli bacterium]|jgi:hypothetical protein|nr:hypothetical protein [Bacilli bacterium]
MNLDKYNIEKLITWSNIRMNEKEKKLSKFSVAMGCIFLLGLIVAPYKYVLLGAAISSFVTPVSFYIKNAQRRVYASSKLRKVAKELGKNGIHTTRLKLQKATTFTTRSYNEDSESYLYGIGKVQTTIFQDNYGQLKALQQIRSELLREPYSYIACLRDCVKEVKCESIDRQYTKIVKDSPKVKQLLLENKRNKN